MRLATYPGRPDKANEDFVGVIAAAGPTCAVLLDGAGGPSEMPTGCIHGTPWYVQRLGTQLLSAMTRYVSEPLTHLLATSIEVTAQAHPGCDLGNPGTPSSTVVMARLRDNLTEYLVLGDSTLYADGLGAVTDARIDDVAAHLFGEVAALPTGSPEHQAARIRYVAHQRSMRNQAGGYWTAGADPSAAFEAYTGTIERAPDPEPVVLLSDGATRFIDFGLGGWNDLMHLLKTGGPDQLHAQVRAAEAADPDGERWPRAKRYDDLSAIII